MILISGGIGAGKSIVSRFLRMKGYGVFDCDYEARRIMENDESIIEEIKEIAGNDIYIENKLDRKRLGSLLFKNESVRKKVNFLVHSAVRKRICEWKSLSIVNLFVETAIPYESKLTNDADEVWEVKADFATKLQRIQIRDKRSLNQIEDIMKSQEEEEKNLRATGIKVSDIWNNPDDLLIPRIDFLLKQISMI